MASDEILRVELLKREFATLSLIEAEDVLLLEWHARTPDNRLDPDGVAQLTECLEAAEKRAREGKTRGLIFSGGSRKHFSNGFDLSALGSLPTDQSRDGFVKAFAGLLSRILSLPLHTIGLVNGHAYVPFPPNLIHLNLIHLSFCADFISLFLLCFFSFRKLWRWTCFGVCIRQSRHEL